MPSLSFDIISTIIRNLSAVGIQRRRDRGILYLPESQSEKCTLSCPTRNSNQTNSHLAGGCCSCRCCCRCCFMLLVLPATLYLFSIVGVFDVERSVGIKEAAASTAATFLCSSLFVFFFLVFFFFSFGCSRI